MIRRTLPTLLLVLLLTQISFAEQPSGRERFLDQAEEIDPVEAVHFADALTAADWYEADTDMLLDGFRAALEVKHAFPWGESYSDEIYRRYVLPLRVDDEPLQPYRRQFMDEIGARIDTISCLSRAALEVNLWLGERVGFQSTDWRDQGPLTTLSCGFGRCGEMMIVAIDAMRSVGIPARGVYVPFWSHSDNNHAWIEVYTEEGWKYMGACEPAPRLNQAWFDDPVLRASVLLSRGKMVSADDPDAVKIGSSFAINVTRNYVSPAQLVVDVPEDWGEEDRVWFSLFNFGAVRPIVELVPKEGVATLEMGQGDFLLMGLYKGELFFQSFTTQIGRETHLSLDTEASVPQVFTLSYPWPPVDRERGPEILPQHRIDLGNWKRRERDANRSWDSEWLDRWIAETSPAWGADLLATLKRAPGNEATILDGVLDQPEGKRETAVFIVSNLSDKDLRDVSPEVLNRWLARTPIGFEGEDELKPYVLDPQIAYEYPGTGLPADYVTESPSYASLDEIRADVAAYSDFVDDEARQRPLPPVTIDHMLADGVHVSKASATIWWTDRMRRAGIPARCQPFSEWLEFHFNGSWLPLLPDQAEKLGDLNALPDVAAHYEEPAMVIVQWAESTSAPSWYSEFLLLPIGEKGLADYRSDNPVELKEEESSTVVTVAPGSYLLFAGRRNGRGDVAMQVQQVELASEQIQTIKLDITPPPEPPSSRGFEVSLADLDWQPKRGTTHLLIVLGDNEPSKRTRGLVDEITMKGLHVGYIEGLDKLSEGDRTRLGLEDRTDEGAPFVYYFDEEGKLLFSQAGYDLNLPSRLRNTLR
ncbi:transglutaminase-like domain-containing protein [bacterium]|nr:transglutaminase-like domain-containing protein [bacterium]